MPNHYSEDLALLYRLATYPIVQMDTYWPDSHPPDMQAVWEQLHGLADYYEGYLLAW